MNRWPQSPLAFARGTLLHSRAMAKAKKKATKGTRPASSKGVARSLTASTAVEEVAPEFESDDIEEFALGDLQSTDRQFLARVARFLIAIQSPKYMRRALRSGYVPSEHQEGWALWSTAAGRDRPLEHHLGAAEITVSGNDPERLATLQRLDEFENRWFPRVRAVIQRVMPEGPREKMESAFFKDLSQQPLGPLVVDSVSTFLSRLEGLRTSKESGAKAVYDTLVKRGLTPAVLATIRKDVDGIKAPGSLPVVSPNTAEIAKGRASQLGALDALRRWWNDWGTTLRPSFDMREQVALGLTEVKVGARASGAPAEPAAPQQVAATD